MTDASEIIDFWRDAGPKAWFAKDEDFDAMVRVMFEDTHHAAACGELSDWENTDQGALALLLLLDQFPRNMYRGSAHAFATEASRAKSPIARSTAASIASPPPTCGHSSICRSNIPSAPRIKHAPSRCS